MSHSTVLVIGPKDDEELARALAPFNEELRVEPYHDYVDPAPEGWERGIANRKRFLDLKDSGVAHKEAWTTVWGDRNDDPRLDYRLSAAYEEAGIDPHDLHAVAKWWNAKDDEETLAVDGGGLYRVSTYNPDSRWDWWSLGGRWAGSLLLKPAAEALESTTGQSGLMDSKTHEYDGRHVDRAEWSSIDWERMGAEQVERRRATYREAMAESDVAFRAFRFGVEDDQTEDDYVRAGVGFSTFAILTPDGEWLERGKMGWWGAVRDEKDADDWHKEWHATVGHYCDDDTVVSVVDVHI